MLAHDISFKFELYKIIFQIYMSRVKSLEMLYISNYIFIKNFIFHGTYKKKKNCKQRRLFVFTSLYI